MRILRPLLGGFTVLVSTAVVVLVSADRLAQLRTAAPPVAARPVPVEPSTTGSVPAPVRPVPAARPQAPTIPSGFDTERLHALMRGDPILPGR